MQAYWLVGRVLLTPPAEAAASQKWKIIYLHVLNGQIKEGFSIGCCSFGNGFEGCVF